MNTLQKELLFACFRGDVDGVRYYLEKGANMNVICPSGRTSFGAAAQLGNVEILQVFLDHCKKGEKKSTECKPKGDSRKMKLVLKEKCIWDFDHEDTKSSSLPSRSENLNTDSQKEIEDKIMLMNKMSYELATFNDSFIRRDPRFKSKNSMNEIDLSFKDEELTPDGMDKLEWDAELEDIKNDFSREDVNVFDCFMHKGMILIPNSLLRMKPPPNDINREDKFGCRALHYAAFEGHVEAVKLLINAGCKVNVGDSDNLTPLHMAAAKDNPEVVELLIEAGANINHRTTDRISPLHVAASRGLLNNVKLLVNAGAHIDTLDSSDRNPLFMAVSRSHHEVVAFLLEHGAKVNLEEIHGYTPLYEAVWQKNTTIVKLLLDAGAKITQSHYLLHYAVLHRHEEMVKLLISAGSIINLRDENGNTPLIVAAKTHQTKIARLLLQNGASIKYTNFITGNNPLHEAICNMSRGESHKFEEMFSIFQEFNIDLEAESDAGYTALCLAIDRGFDEIAAMLIRHGADVNHPQIVHFDLFHNVFLKGKYFLSALFIYAGYRFHDIILPDEPLSPLQNWVVSMKINPMRLCDLCRILIRSRFKNKIYEKVSQLMLPNPIKTFLKLEDIGY